ncbi:MAG: tRNA pseudouridine(38-40) synthase TruA [Thermotogae bacterium]|nr:tRNA pseudouridine(38-40) synthase TruA [Thermotogota bacterium]
MNLKLTLSYDGTDFYGWQVQPGRRTVAGELHRVLDRLVEGEYRLVGVGRTDAGVHAIGYVANLKVSGRLRVPSRSLMHRLNRMLPDDIYVRSVERVPEDFHARYSAKYKIYRYLFGREYDPLMRRRVWFLPHRLNVLHLNEAMRLLLGTHDFTYLAADERENGVCTLYDITFGHTGGWVFMDVKGNRFLRKMVRFMASLSVMLSEGRVAEEDVVAILRGEGRPRGLTPAPPWGLYLLEVGY